jgi:Tol biopolymer transport system component
MVTGQRAFAGEWYPRFSPDGQTVAFDHSSMLGQSDIMLVENFR